MNRPNAVLALLLASLGPTACAGSEREAPVRIVLITVDTLRKDAWEPDAAGRVPMARTLERAGRGLVFERAFAASSSTQPSHVSLLSGLQPWQHGVSRNGLRVGPEVELLAERLARAGFENHAVVASFPVSSVHGFARGFVTFADEFERATRSGTWNGQDLEGEGFYSLGDEVTARAIAALDAARGPRQFLWVHYFDPHDPYGDTHRVPEPGASAAAVSAAAADKVLSADNLRRAAREQDRRLPQAIAKARSLYMDDVRRLDVWLDELLARLESDAGRIETHVVITSDHGESFGEDDSLGHGHRLTAPQVHVPLAILSPRVRSGRREDVCGSVDVYATLLDLAGLPTPSRGSRSLLGEAGRTAASAFGMRRTFATPQFETHVDGSVSAMDEAHFFAATQDGLIVGREGALLRLPEGTPVEDASLSSRFASFEAELATRDELEVDDPASLEALRSLGYAR